MGLSFVVGRQWRLENRGNSGILKYVACSCGPIQYVNSPSSGKRGPFRIALFRRCLHALVARYVRVRYRAIRT